MIKANELRIGNWVELKNSGHVKIDVDNIGDIVNNPAIFDPIPLTPEILEKAWFEIQESLGGYHQYKLHGIWVNISQTGELFAMYKDTTLEHTVDNFYLHHLQNLFFALTGEELTVNFKELTID